MTMPPGPSLLPLPTDRLDVWCVRLDERWPHTLTESYLALLTCAERQRHSRYAVDHARHAYLVTRALVRCALSTYCDVDPRRWRFRSGTHGRPEISEPIGLPPLSFNLSNTAGLVVGVVTLGRDVGIDAERRARDRVPDVVEDALPEADAARLRGLPEPVRTTRFFELWTLRESYVKARGLGLTLPLDRFSFGLDTGTPRLRCEPSFDDPPAWQFALVRPGPVHIVAIAARTGPGAVLPVEIRDVVPFATAG